MKGGRVPIHIMRWAPQDFENDEAVKLAIRRRNYRALAFYMAFINHSFMAGGDLPGDPERIAATLGWHRGDVEAAVRYWLEEGKLIEANGRLMQKRVARDVEAELAYRTEQAALGRKGGETAGRGRPKQPIGDPLIEDRATPTGIDRPAVRRAPAPAPAPERMTGPANPLIARGGRPKLESELCALVHREAELTERDGAEVMAEVSHYEGARTSKLNPATMSDDRLLNSLLDARARVKRLEEKQHVRA